MIAHYLQSLKMTTILLYTCSHTYTGFQLEVDKFFIYYLTLVQAVITGSALAFAMSALVGVTAVANLMTAMLYVLSMVSLE